MSPAPVSILIADREPAVRASIAAALRARAPFDVVGEAGDGKAALAQIHASAPDVALVQADLPQLEAADLALAIRRAGLPTRLVVTAADDGDPEPLARGIALGAAGGVRRSAGADRLAEVVTAVARGELRLPAELQDALVRRFRDQWPENRPQLTCRQREVLTLVADGLSGPQIAEVLFVSPSTVKTHLENLYDALGVAERAAAVAVGMRTGLIS